MLLGKIIDLGDISEVCSQTARLLELGKELNKQQVQLFNVLNLPYGILTEKNCSANGKAQMKAGFFPGYSSAAG